MGRIFNFFGSFASFFDPKSIAGLNLWLDATDLSTITKDGSDYVSKWIDKSVNAYNFDQDTASSQPQYIGSGFGTESKPYIDFDGVNDKFGNPDTIFISGNDYTLFAVFTQDSGASEQMILVKSSGGNSVAIMTAGGKAGLTNFSDKLGVGGSYTSADPTLISGWLSPQPASPRANVEINGVAASDTVAIGIAGALGNGIGGRFGDTGDQLNGKITELMSYEGKLTEAQITQVNNYLNDKYGIY